MNDLYINLSPKSKEKLTHVSRKVSLNSRKSNSDFSGCSMYEIAEKSKLKFVKLLKPLYLFIMAVFFISLMNICTKILFELYSDIGIHTINFFKGFHLILLSMLFMKIDKIDLSSTKNFDKNFFEKGILRVILLIIVYIFSILSLKYTKFSNFISLMQIGPLFIIIFQKTLDKEKFSKKDGKFLMLVGFAIVLISLENYFPSNFLISGVIYGFIASLFFSSSIIIQGKFPMHIYVFLFLLGSILLCISLILIPINSESIEIFDFNCFFLLFLIGITSFFGHYFSLKTLKRNNTFFVEILLNFTVFLAFFYGYYFFDEGISFFSFWGTMIIIGVNLYRIIINSN